jgi:hypothetical protein
MVNGKMPLYLTVLALGLLGAALMVFQPYSADFPGTGYAEPARQYIRAAMHQDSTKLTRLSVSSGPVAWALDAGRAHGDSLALWERHIQAWIGERHGDTAEVFVYPPGKSCGEDPIVFRFVGTGRSARVLAASSTCWGP